jgi:hypothetical protein
MHTASPPTHISLKEPATRNRTPLKLSISPATGRLLRLRMTTLQLMPDKKLDSTIRLIQVPHLTTVQNYLNQTLMTSVTISITPRKSTMISASGGSNLTQPCRLHARFHPLSARPNSRLWHRVLTRRMETLVFRSTSLLRRARSNSTLCDCQTPGSRSKMT